MTKIITAPNALPPIIEDISTDIEKALIDLYAVRTIEKSLFLAGSIEMGTAEDWQKKLIYELDDKCGFRYIFNPRRENWDSTWEQSIHNPNFREQVEWELSALDRAETILIYFDPNTKSPISLLELGLYASTGKVFIVCPDGFWRKGNVEIVAHKYGIPMMKSLDDFIEKFKTSQRQIFTFGHGHAHFGKYHVIEANSKSKCRELMFHRFGNKWSMQYDSEEAAGVERWNLKELK